MSEKLGETLPHSPCINREVDPQAALRASWRSPLVAAVLRRMVPAVDVMPMHGVMQQVTGQKKERRNKVAPAART